MKSDYLPLPVFLLLLSPTAIAWADKPAQLQDRIPAEGTTPSGHVTWYTDDDPASLDYFPAAKAQEVHDAHELAHARFILYGFNAPHYSAFPKELHIYDSADGGSAPHDSITLDAPSKKDRPEPRNRSTMPHELFHHVRYR